MERDKRKEKGLEKELWAGTGNWLVIAAWLSFSAERNQWLPWGGNKELLFTPKFLYFMCAQLNCSDVLF